MNNLLVCLIAAASFVVAGTCNAGVAPTHDQSQLSQSGAKIAPPKKAEDDAQKKEEEAKKEKEQQQPTGERR
jgi:hypothetical protein